MVYCNLSTDKNMLEVCTIRHLTDIKYEHYGDGEAELAQMGDDAREDELPALR